MRNPLTFHIGHEIMARIAIPLLGGLQPKARPMGTRIGQGLVMSSKTLTSLFITSDIFHPLQRELWANIIKYQPIKRIGFLYQPILGRCITTSAAQGGFGGLGKHGNKSQCNQTAHRSTQPGESCWLQTSNQAGKIRHVLAKSIKIRILKPICGPPPRHIRADHPVFVTKAARYRIKIAAIAGQTVHAQQHIFIALIPPLPITHAMPSPWIGAQEITQGRFGPGRMLAGHDKTPMAKYTKKHIVTYSAWVRQRVKRSCDDANNADCASAQHASAAGYQWMQSLVPPTVASTKTWRRPAPSVAAFQGVGARNDSTTPLMPQQNRDARSLSGAYLSHAATRGEAPRPQHKDDRPVRAQSLAPAHD